MQFKKVSKLCFNLQIHCVLLTAIIVCCRVANDMLLSFLSIYFLIHNSKHIATNFNSHHNRAYLQDLQDFQNKYR